MLNVIYGNTEDYVFNTNMYFDNTYEDNWITSDLSRQIIKDIDKSEVKSSNCIESPYLGQIPPERLSGGTKTLLLILNDKTGNLFNASTCGDNCAKWLLQMAKDRDITIVLLHNMNFGDNFELRINNTGDIVHSMAELIPISHNYLC